jgi:hypothetical protein
VSDREAARQRFLRRLADWGDPGSIVIVKRGDSPTLCDQLGEIERAKRLANVRRRLFSIPWNRSRR